MIERQNDDALVDDMKRMADLTRIPYAGKTANIPTMRLQEFKQLRRGPVGEAKYDLMPDLSLGRVASNAAENGKAAVDGLIDGRQVAGLHVRHDAIVRVRKVHQVPPDMALCTQSKVHERMAAAHLSGQRQQGSPKLFAAVR